MAGFTNRGKRNILGLFRAESLPTNLYVALVTSAVAPTADTDTLGTLTQIAAGNGYTSGGIQLTYGSTDFDVLTENDTSDLALLQIKDMIWTGTAGPIPSSGDGARYAVLTDDDGTMADREVWAYWDLSSDRSVVDGQSLKLIDLQLNLTET